MVAKASDKELYGFTNDFEQCVALLSCTRPQFYAAVGHALEVERFSQPEVSLLVRAAQAHAKDTGRGPTSVLVVLQRIQRWVGEGKTTQEELGAADAMLDDVDDEIDEAEVTAELVPVVQRLMKGDAALAAIEVYRKGGDFDGVKSMIRKSETLGVLDRTTGSRLGIRSFDRIQQLQQGDRLATGVLELDIGLGGGLPRAKTALFCAPSKGGKCHAKGTRVLMHDGGTKLVEDVVVGDQLMGPDSAPRNVLRTNIGRGEMFDVVPKRGDRWRVNADHVLTVRVGGKLVDVSVREWMTWSKWMRGRSMLERVGVSFPKRSWSLGVDPYILGVILGDGSTVGTDVRVTTMDKEIVAELQVYARDEGLRLVPHKRMSGRARSYGLSGTPGVKNPVAEALEQYGLRHMDSGSKRIPPEYKLAESRVRTEILAGLLDTDGWFDSKKLRYEFVSKSKGLANDAAFVARSLGFGAHVTACRKSCQTGAVGTYYRLHIVGDVWTIPCRVQRKRAAARGRKYDVVNTGFDVVPSGMVEDYYGFSLDGDSRYLLGDFTVTHNSQWLISVASFAMRAKHFVMLATLGDLDEEDQEARLIANLTGYPIDTVIGGSDRANLESAMSVMLPSLGPFVTKFFVPKETTFRDIADWVKEVEAEEKRKVDLLIVDYIDELGSGDPKLRSEYEVQGQTMRDMRMWVRAHGCWGWTAAQPKRREVKERTKRIEIDDIADSMKKGRIADMILTCIKPTEDEVELYVAGNRHGRDKFSVGPMPHDFARGRFSVQLEDE